MIHTDYSLVVISRNRPQFLARLFLYYHSQGLAAPIFVGDSSSGAARNEISVITKQFCGKLNLEVTTYPDTTPPLERLILEISKVTSRYVAWVGDDDFLIPRALSAGTQFLDAQSEYSAITGKALLFTITGEGPHGNVASVGNYGQSGFTASSAAARLISCTQMPVNLTYCLRRTDVAQRIMTNLDGIAWPDDRFGYHFFEILDTFLLVVAGKVKMLENLLMVRQAHSASTAASASGQHKAFRYISHPRWPEFCKNMLGMLASGIANSDAIGYREAEELAELAISIKLGGTLRKQADAELAKRNMPDSPEGRPAIRRPFLNSMPRLRRFGILARLRGSLSAGDYGNLMEIICLVESAKA